MKKAMYAFITEGEGIVAAQLGPMWHPLVTVEERIVPMMKDKAREIAKLSGKVIKLHHFVLDHVEELD